MSAASVKSLLQAVDELDKDSPQKSIMDTFTLSVLISLLSVGLVALLWLRSKQSLPKEKRRGPPAPNARQQDVPVGARGRRGGPRMRRGNQEQAGDVGEVDEQPELDERREELEEAGVKVPDGKIGKKKMEKLQMKAEKKMAREAEEAAREEAKKKKAEKEEEEAKQRAKEEAEEKKRLEEEQREREEKERREHEEYLKLKAAFEVEEEGYDEDGQQEDEENKLQIFIDYIKETKVVLLEDLAAHFKLKTQEAIDRVTQLQEDKMLTGVIDDRGKFIYISPDELEAVAKFIRQRGRVSISDLAESSNQLINLSVPAKSS